MPGQFPEERASEEATMMLHLACEARGKAKVIGVLLDPDDGTRKAMGEIFGEGGLIACASSDLPKKLAAMLRSVRWI